VTPKRKLLSQKHIIRRIDHCDWSSRFLHSSPFYSAPNPMLYNTFNRPDTPEVPLPMEASAAHVIHVPCTQPTQHPKLHVDWFSRFCTAHGRGSLSLWCALKINVQFKKIIAAINTKMNRLTALIDIKGMQIDHDKN